MLIHERMSAAMDGRRGIEAADRLCEACVNLLSVDAAAISLVFDGANTGTLGASSSDARMYDELQFTFGEGPCLDSVALCIPIVVRDLAEPSETRWPGYGQAMLAHQIHSVYALPVVLAGEYIAALDLYRHRASVLDPSQLEGALAAAVLAEKPLLDLLADDLRAAIGTSDGDAWSELTSLSRVEIGQATGVLMAQLDIDVGEALIRLRAHAYATGRSASAVARDILEHGLRLEADP